MTGRWRKFLTALSFHGYPAILNRSNLQILLHRRGPYNQEQLEDALKKFLPFDGEQLLSYDVEYMDEDLGEVVVANFVWLNEQWVYVDSRSA